MQQSAPCAARAAGFRRWGAPRSGGVFGSRTDKGRDASPQESAPDRVAQNSSRSLLHALLVGLDHLLDHLAADGAGFAGGQVAVVAVLQVDANLPWCPK